MNDQENYGGTCYNASGTSTITCPPQASYTPYPTYTPTSSGSCPSGSHTMYVNGAGGYCMSDSDGSKCGPLSSTSVSSFGSCSSYQTTTTYTPLPSCPSGQWWDYSRNACVSSTSSYTPYPSCPSGQWWDYSSSTCKSNDSSTYSPYPTTSYTPYTTTTFCGPGYYWDSASNACKSTCPSTQYWNGSACVDNVTTTYTPPAVTYTPYPTTEYTPPPYTPPPSCPSGQYWDGSSCVVNPPPPTSSLYPHHMIAHCQQLGRTWNGETCRANGLFARIYESYTSDFAAILKAFGF